MPAQERKRIMRLVIREVVLDQTRETGIVWMRIFWQTSSASEHWLQCPVRTYEQCASAELLERRIRELTAASKPDPEIAAILNAKGVMSARGVPFGYGTIYRLRKL